jgi:dTDP-4-dehydrorhamnose 3,5-epimerase
MIFNPLNLRGAYIIDLEPKRDERGWFARYYCKEEFQRIGHAKEWLQMNHSFTAKKGTIRGMHYQMHPFKEVKLLRCIKGTIHDVILDIRKDSPTFLQWVSVILSAENKKMLYIPEGFAHGFQSLEDGCELLYHHSALYNAEAESGIRYDDPLLQIDWPLAVTIVSKRDTEHILLTNDFRGI